MEVLTKAPNGLLVTVKPDDLSEALKKNALASGSSTVKMIVDDYIKNMNDDLELIKLSN